MGALHATLLRDLLRTEGTDDAEKLALRFDETTRASLSPMQQGLTGWDRHRLARRSPIPPWRKRSPNSAARHRTTPIRAHPAPNSWPPSQARPCEPPGTRAAVRAGSGSEGAARPARSWGAGVQLGMEGVIHGRRADRPETQPLDPGLQAEHEEAVDPDASSRQVRVRTVSGFTPELEATVDD